MQAVVKESLFDAVCSVVDTARREKKKVCFTDICNDKKVKQALGTLLTTAITWKRKKNETKTD